MAIKKATKKVSDDSVTLNFTDETQIVAALASIPNEIKTRLCLHGLSQKLGDSYAGAESVADAFAAATRVLKDLVEGNWKTAREGGTGGVRTTLLAEALARVASAQTGEEVTVEQAREVIEGMNDDEKKAVRNDSAIQVSISEIKLERAQADAAEKPSDIKSLFAASGEAEPAEDAA